MSINGEAFQGLNKLKKVYLSGNPYIDENFENSTQIAVLPQILNEECRFEESSAIKPNLALLAMLFYPCIMIFHSWKFNCFEWN